MAAIAEVIASAFGSGMSWAGIDEGSCAQIAVIRMGSRAPGWSMG